MRAFFLPFILLEASFFNIFLTSMYSWLNTVWKYTFTYQKTLLHTFIWLFLKSSIAFSVCLRCVFVTRVPKLVLLIVLAPPCEQTRFDSPWMSCQQTSLYPHAARPTHPSILQTSINEYLIIMSLTPGHQWWELFPSTTTGGMTDG